MINKEEMLALVRSVAVADDVEQGMSHAFDLGVDWERARVVKILGEWIKEKNGPDDLLGILQDVSHGNEYK